MARDAVGPETLMRRRAARAMAYSVLVSLLIVVAYFVLPLSSAVTATTAVTLALGLSLIVLVLAWHLHEIIRSPYPRVRAAAALVTLVPLFLVVFAASYVVLSQAQPSSFSERLDRMSAAYYTVTVFATVGFGDIAPVTTAARAATTVQMLGGLVLVGVAARVILGAARVGVARKEVASEVASTKNDEIEH